jgi:hypothetical protein
MSPYALQPWALSYQLWTHTTYGTITIQKHSDFALEAPLCLLLATFQFPFCYRRALSPYMVQEMLMADGSASEVLWTHIQCKRHSRLISSTSTVL